MAFRMNKIFPAVMGLLFATISTGWAQTVTFTKNDVTCNGGSDGDITLTLSGGTSSYRYVIYETFEPSISDSFGPTTNLSHTFSGLDANVYTVFVRDVGTGNVLAFNTLIVNEPGVLTGTVSQANVSCFGGLTGSITISSPTGGSGSYEYTINGGGSWQVSGSFTGLGSGTYNVMMRDRNAPLCMRTLQAALLITEPAQLNAVVNSTHVTCFGLSNGTIVVSAPSGGSGSYQYSRNNGATWQASGTFTNLPPATYQVVIRDAAAITCTRVLNNNLLITQPNQLTVTDISIIKGLTCNEGSDARLQAVVTGGTAPYAYTWYVNPGSGWNPIGQTNQTAVNLPQGWYEVRVNDANNCGVPTPASARELFLYGVPPGDTIPAPFVFDSASVVTTCQGQTNGSLTLYAHGGKAAINYSITAGGAGGYQAANLFSGLAAGNYEVWARDGKGCRKTGGTETIGTTPNAPVSATIAANPSGAICPGTSVLFTATPVNGGTTPVYQWLLNGAPVGTGGSTYTNATLASGDQVRVVLTSSLRCTSGNPATSNTLVTSLLSPPVITGQPSGLTRCPGTAATFTVTATGAGLTYQWRKNGVNIPGATNASYTIASVVPGDAGNYTVVVAGTCGTVTSNTATLTVNANVAITTQPANVTQCQGGNATFTVVATGTGLAYQWRKNGVNIGGATSSSLTLNNIIPADAGNYDVIVTGTCNSVTSAQATLVVNLPPAITTQPVNIIQCQGTNATFTITATGAGLTYQWCKNGVNIAGAINASLTLNNIAPADAGVYDVVVTGTCGSVTSGTATLAVNTPPVVTTQPVSIAQCVGGNATFSVTATGTGLTYQWRKNGTNIPGATGSSLTLTSITPADAGNYDVLITGTCGNAASVAATLTVNTAPAIATQPANLTQCQGSPAVFNVVVTGSGLTYQWRKNGVNIPGATSPSYAIASVAPADAGSFDVVITGTCGTLTSNAASLTVNTPPAISTQPANVTQCQGLPATFTVAATGTGLSYQWQKNGLNIAGAIGTTYTIASVMPVDAGTYRVVITGTCGNLNSANATLVVNTPPAISLQPAGSTQCEGGSASFSVTATGTGLTYQWRKNGSNIPGATSATYTINNLVAGDAGSYDVVITGSCATVTSTAAALVVDTAPVITGQPAGITQCQGTPAIFAVAATGSGLTYQWQKNSTNIPGATGNTYTIASLVPADAGTYRVVITGTCGTLTSNNAVLVVNTAPAITTQPAGATRCEGGTATLRVTATGTGLTFQWRKNGVNVAGATNAMYTISGVVPADAGNYDVVITGTCGTITSATAVLTVNPSTVITLQPAGGSACAGTAYSFTVGATGASLTYQWRKNGTNIPGATGATYLIASVAAGDAGNYTVVVSGTCGNVTSASASLVVEAAPAIATQPQPLTTCEGTAAVFSVTATGAGLNYQWRKDGVVIAGATSASYTIPVVNAASAGNYDVLITGTCGFITSSAAALTVAEAPVVGTHPLDQEVCGGEDVSFTVAASGTGITYQWRRNGTILPGQTAPLLTLTGVTPSQSGIYDALVYGLCDTLASNPAVLTVNPATAVIAADEDTLVCEGSTVDFNISAVGSGSLTYQWQWRYLGNWIDLTNEGDVSGVATPALRIANVEAADSGYYRCFVTSACGTAYSDSMLLDINEIVATIGTPSPFLIDSATTVIEVSVRVTDRFLKWDLGFALVAPDGTEVLLKGPLDFPCAILPFNNEVDAVFTTQLNRQDGDTINWCLPTRVITGTFAATGDWNVLHGKDPANGAWQVRVYDNDKSVPDPDGYLRRASLTFTDLNTNGDTVSIRYNSGDIQEEILNPISGELRATAFVVPIRLTTSCFNTNDAHAVVTVRGGVAPFDFLWSGPTSVPNSDDVFLGPGTYTVTVTDALGCSTDATVEVTSPPAIVWADVVATDSVLCFESAEGVIRSIASGGTGLLRYTLLPGDLVSEVADSGVFTSLPPGAYIVRSTDINGCQLDTSIAISSPPALMVDIVVVPVVGETKGSITLTASGGTPPYRYSTDNGATLYPAGLFENLDAADYPVYVVDTNGCVFTQLVSLNVNPLHVSVSVENISCNGLVDGSFLLAATDGVGPYTLTGSFLMDPVVSPTGFYSFTSQSAGLYDIRITDGEGRVFIDTVEITEPPAIQAVADITPAQCTAGTSDGAIVLATGGGTGDLSFAWDDGVLTKDRVGISAGSYGVTVTDTTGCSAGFDFSVPGLFGANAFAGLDDTICPGAEYQLIGSAADSMYWEPEEWLSDPDIQDPFANILTSTEFVYTVYQDGCTDSDTVVLGAYERIGMDIYDPSGQVDIDTALFLLEGETYTMAATPGFETYLWQPGTWLSDPALPSVVVSPQGNITYYVFGTTADGCVETDAVHVVIASQIEIFTGFSPNGDGTNDTWVIRHAAEYGERITIKVFNRWGQPVYDSKGYASPWDGTRNGKPLPVAAYYYIIEVDDGKSEPYTGTVTILR